MSSGPLPNTDVESALSRIENFSTKLSDSGDIENKTRIAEKTQIANDIALCLNEGISLEKMEAHIRTAVWKRPETSETFYFALQKVPNLTNSLDARLGAFSLQTRFSHIDASELKGTFRGMAAVQLGFPLRDGLKQVQARLSALFPKKAKQTRLKNGPLDISTEDCSSTALNAAAAGAAASSAATAVTIITLSQ